MSDLPVWVEDEGGRGPPDIQPADQVEPGLGIDFHVRDTIHHAGDIAQDLSGRAARSAEGRGELHQSRPVAERGTKVGMRQPGHRLGAVSRGGPDPAVARPPAESERSRRDERADARDQSSDHARLTWRRRATFPAMPFTWPDPSRGRDVEPCPARRGDLEPGHAGLGNVALRWIPEPVAAWPHLPG